MKKSSAIALLALLGLSGCRKEVWDDCFTGVGDIVSDERMISGFTGIDISDRFDLVIVPDTVDRVILETGDRLLEQIRTELDGGTLVVRDGNTCNWVRRADVPMTLTVHCRRLQELTCRGTGDVSTQGTIDVPWFHLRLWGAMGTHDLSVNADSCVLHANTGPGDVYLHGNVHHLLLYSGGRGIIDTRDAQADICDVNNSSVNDIYLRANSSVGAVINFSGNVNWTGPGSVAWSDIVGTGQLIHQ
jgi:hypothetical protein